MQTDDPAVVLRDIRNAEKTREYMQMVTGPARERLAAMGLQPVKGVLPKPALHDLAHAVLVRFEGGT